MHRFKASKYRNAVPKIPKKEVGTAVVHDLCFNDDCQSTYFANFSLPFDLCSVLFFFIDYLRSYTSSIIT